MTKTIAELREEYAGAPLVEEAAQPDPLAQFQRWLDEAIAAGAPLANAMTLATATARGEPSARIVLLKQVDPCGFVFFTNHGSRKGGELEENPRAALLFYWAELHRQVRIEGRVERVSEAESDAYFATRPRASNLSAIASPQSRPVAGRAALERLVSEVEAALNGDGGAALARPDYWGGYRVLPHTLEFWQGRPDRLHDRLRYRQEPDGSWRIDRLAP